MAGPVGFGDYLKAALLQHWNLLYMVAIAGFAILSPGHRETILALGAAGELTMLAGLIGSDRFRRVVNAQRGAEESKLGAEELTRRFNALYVGLSKDAKAQFDQLKRRCEALRGTDFDTGEGIEKMSENQLQGANRLLWVYLKLLHTHGALQRFLETTDAREIDALDRAARAKLNEIPADAAGEIDAKKRRSLEDTLASVTARRENLQRARENLEFVQLELARIASKVTALTEMTVMRQDPARISTEVDDAARSVETTEQAIGELRMFNGLTAEDSESAPPILTAPMPRVQVR
jgi:hypothetical protein